jgi:hypothetical protein
VKSREGVEKTVLVDDRTEIRRFRETVELTNLKNDDFIVTIGEANQSGQIVAKLIRVMPPAPKNGPDRGRFPTRDEMAPGQLPPPSLDGAILIPPSLPKK